MHHEQHIDEAYIRAFADWMACAMAGQRRSGGAQLYADRGSELKDSGVAAEIVALGMAGHVLDFDDTYVPGLAHISAAVAPVATVLASRLGRTVRDMLLAYSRGFEAMAVMSADSHPDLYERGWHSTAVCGSIGAAIAAAELLELTEEQTDNAIRLSMLRAAGLRSAFGSIGKSFQVGAAAADGYVAAAVASTGAQLPQAVATGVSGFEEVYGAVVDRVFRRDFWQGAIHRNWIKAYPCCLQTHAPVAAGLELASRTEVDAGDRITLFVHPLSLLAASYGDVANGLEAKFSIPYTTAAAILGGAPTLETFDSLDTQVQAFASRIEVRTDDSLGANGCRLEQRGASLDSRAEMVIEVHDPLGSPANPMDDEQLSSKIVGLCGQDLKSMLADPDAPAERITNVFTSSGKSLNGQS